MACAGVAFGSIGGELCRNRTPQRLIDNRRVFAGIGLSLVKGLTEVGAVLQYRVERTARKWLAADQAWWKPRVFEPRVSPMSSSGAFTIP